MAQFTEDEFDAIYMTYGKKVYSFAAWLLGDKQEAWDITQETFLRLYQAKVAEKSIRSWLYKTAYHLVADYWRRNSRTRVTVLNEMIPDFALDSNPEAAFLSKEYRERFLQVFGSLPVQYRAILLLREKNNASYDEIAKIIGITVGAVRSRLYRARMTLLRGLQEQEGQR